MIARIANTKSLAVMSATMLAGFAGIGSEEATDNSAAYLQGWIKKLKNDKGLFMAAAAAAQKAADFILGAEAATVATDTDVAKAA